MNAEDLVEHLKKDTQVLKSPRIEEALLAVDRKLFVPEELHDEAYEDYALPIGYGQTISQPTTVAFMLELLDPKPGEKILDVGSGSGWTAALLSRLVGEKGSVLGLEIVPELVALGQKNLAKIAPTNAHIEQAGKELGCSAEAPHDRILVSAAADSVPEGLARQLRERGRMVIPIQDSICVVERKGDGYTQQCHPGFAFVPLVAR